MKLAIVGSGNVASVTLLELAQRNYFTEIIWTARNIAKAETSLRDVMSAFPDFGEQVRLTDTLSDEYPDVMVITAGVHIAPTHATKHLATNINTEIIKHYASFDFKDSTIAVIVASPVDELTAIAATFLPLPPKQIVGFGGDLDLSRLKCVLARRGLPTEPIALIGEHGHEQSRYIRAKQNTMP